MRSLRGQGVRTRGTSDTKRLPPRPPGGKRQEAPWGEVLEQKQEGPRPRGQGPLRVTTAAYEGSPSEPTPARLGSGVSASETAAASSAFASSGRLPLPLPPLRST